TYCQGNTRHGGASRPCLSWPTRVTCKSLRISTLRVPQAPYRTLFNLKIAGRVRALLTRGVKCKTGRRSRTSGRCASSQDDALASRRDVAGCVASIHDQMAVPNHEIVVDSRVVGGDEHGVRGSEILLREGHGAQLEVVAARRLEHGYEGIVVADLRVLA